MAKIKEEKTKTKAEKAKKEKINYADLTPVELKKAEDDLRKELYEMRSKVKVASLSDVKKIKKNKRNIARILTVLKQRALNEHG
ncbi:MAG: 50S ribosomal protein L29 [Spirochaetia bacterium]|nr:50S ribosomal protein L29 [Spirochaetia bacterium]